MTRLYQIADENNGLSELLMRRNLRGRADHEPELFMAF